MIKTFKYIKGCVFFYALLLLVTACEKDPGDYKRAIEGEEIIQVIVDTTNIDIPDPVPDSVVPVTPITPEVAIPYSQIPQAIYEIDVLTWDIPNDRTQPEKTTNNLQAAIDWAVANNFGQIKLPAGHYLIGKPYSSNYQAGIELHTNMAFILDDNAIIEMAANDKWNYCAIAITEKNYVFITGGTIVGDRNNHIYTPDPSTGATAHDEGNLICIQNESRFVTIQNTTLRNANGDGILLVGQKGAGSSVNDIHILENNFDNNRRQGISIVGGVDILIENNEIHHTNGISPQFGIDIESLIYTSKDIVIKENYFHHNQGGDIVNTDGRNVSVTNNILEQGDGNTYIDGPLVYKKKGDWRVENNEITMNSGSVNGYLGLVLYTNESPKTNPAYSFINNNICNNCGFYFSNTADLILIGNVFNNGYLSFENVSNLGLEANKVTYPDDCWAYQFRNTSGAAEGNTYNGEPKYIPLSSEPWDGCWIP